MSAGPLRFGRTPSVLLVLLPALLLAAFGARAVQSEVQRAQSEARADASAAAHGLANAFSRAVADVVAPLPDPGSATTVEEAAEALRHLHPRFAVDASGTLLDLTGRAEAGDAGDEEEAESMAADARERAAALLDSGDLLAAATVLAAAAEALDVAHVRAELRLEAATLDFSADETAAGLRLLLRLLDEDAPVTREAAAEATDAVNPTAAPVEMVAFELLFEVLAGEAGATPVPPPAALAELHSALVRDRYRLSPSVRDELAGRVRAHMDSASRRAAEADVERWLAARRAGPQATGTEVRVTRDGALLVRRRVRLTRGDDVLDAWIGGELPARTLAERLADVVAIGGSDGVFGPALLGPDGRVLAGLAIPDTIATEQRVRSAVPGALLSGFATEAAPAGTEAFPRSAVVLAAGVLIASLALLLGASMLTRAAHRNAALAEERRRFLDHVAHEIRTPASALLAMSDELASGQVPVERRPLYHEHLADESRRLARLVEETLDLARLEAGRLAARMETVDLAEIVRGAVSEAAGAEGSVRLSVPDGVVPVTGDAPALRRAVRNLVENALRHGASSAPPEVSLGLTSLEARVVVADSGPGIPAEHLPRIFERFFRVPSATHEVKGVGIGLALCREVARAHGGDVTVRAPVGSGATFTLALPLPGGGAAGYGGGE